METESLYKISLAQMYKYCNMKLYSLTFHQKALTTNISLVFSYEGGRAVG
jgi:hypothetical protein